MNESTVKMKYHKGDTIKYYSAKTKQTKVGRVSSVEMDGKDIVYGLETGQFVKQSELKESSILTFRSFVDRELTEAVVVDQEAYQGVHGKKPKGVGQWIFYSGKYNKGEEFKVKDAKSFADAAQAAKEWAKGKGYYRVYVAA